LLIEVHDRPHEALSDGAQAMLPDDFRVLMRDLRALAAPLGRRIVSTASNP
jgi:3-deoxy-7-phosphoheptulonate synthase